MTGEYVLSLIVSNGISWSEPDYVSIFMEETLNHPPVADAGEDQTIPVNDSTGIQGSATDLDGNAILDWLWSIESCCRSSMTGTT